MIKSILTIALMVNLGYQVPAEPVRAELSPTEMIVEECQKQNIEPTLAIAISRLETGHFTSSAFTNYNNFGGMSVDECPLQYSTKQDGVEKFISNLRTNYIEQGLTTPELISKKYCPVNAENWADVVNELMEVENG